MNLGLFTVKVGLKLRAVGALQPIFSVGSGSKLGIEYPVTAYMVGSPVSIEYLVGFLSEVDGDRKRITGLLLRQNGQLTLAEAHEKYPDWYDRRIIRGERRGRWTVKRDLYDWWLRKIETDIHVGHRFYGIMTLAIYAVKCGIEEDELRRDAYRLLEVFDGMSYEDSNRFTEDDVIKALEMYNEDFVTFPREDISKYSGISILPNKRNWRKQKSHVQYMNNQREFKVSMGECSNGGRPDKKELIRAYMVEHPKEKNKSKIAKELNIHRNTVSNHFDAILRELHVLNNEDGCVAMGDMSELRALLFGKSNG